MRTTVVTTMVCVLFALVTSASAGEWDGVYVGGQIGGGSSSTDWSNHVDQTSTDIFTFDDGQGGTISQTSSFDSVRNQRGSRNDNFGTVGGFLGINATVGSILIGSQIEGSLTGSETDVIYQATSRSSDGSTNNFQDAATIRSDWNAGIIGRLGYLAGNRALIYALGGVNFAEFEVSDFPFHGTSIESVGVSVGGGVEYRVTPKMTLRAEYRFTDYGTEDVHARDTETFASPNSFSQNISTGSGDLDVDTHLINFGLAFSLN